jgi:hypothetical protein
VLATLDVTIGRAVLEPGWSSEKRIKPLVKTERFRAPHTQYIVSGRIKVVMDDGVNEPKILRIAYSYERLNNSINKTMPPLY